MFKFRVSDLFKHLVGDVFKNSFKTHPKQVLGSAFVFDFQKTQTSTHVRKQALNTHTRTQQKNMLGYVSIRNVFKNYVNTHTNKV